MGIELGTALLVGSGILGGASVFSALSAPKAPTLPPLPPPASYQQYDEDGNMLYEQVWDAKKNAYITKFDPEPDDKKSDEWGAWNERSEARARDKQVRAELKEKMLGNLNVTPEDRVKAYEDYARTYSETIHRDVDYRYDKTLQAEKESMEARGLTGSRAYADTIAELGREKGDLDLQIARESDLAKEDLAARDRSYWSSTLDLIESGGRADELLRMQQAQTAGQGAYQGTAALYGQYGAGVQNQLTEWDIKNERSRNLTSTFSDTASGLAFLYGYGKSGSKIAPSNSGRPRNPSNPRTFG